MPKVSKKSLAVGGGVVGFVLLGYYGLKAVLGSLDQIKYNMRGEALTILQEHPFSLAGEWLRLYSAEKQAIWASLGVTPLTTTEEAFSIMTDHINELWYDSFSEEKQQMLRGIGAHVTDPEESIMDRLFAKYGAEIDETPTTDISKNNAVTAENKAGVKIEPSSNTPETSSSNNDESKSDNSPSRDDISGKSSVTQDMIDEIRK